MGWIEKIWRGVGGARVASWWRGRQAGAMVRVKSIAPADMIEPMWASQPLTQDWTLKRTISGGMRNTWVYVAIKKNARTAASVPWKIGRVSSSGEFQELESAHPAREIWERPNTLGGTKTLIHRGLLHYQQHGNALWAITRYDDGTPSELWELHPEQTRPTPSKEEGKVLDGYRFTRADGSYRDIVPEDVLHIQDPDPDSIYWGLSPLKAAGRAVDADNSAAEAQKKGTDNMFAPSAIISPKSEADLTKGAGAMMSKDRAMAERKVFNRQYVGAENAGKVLWAPESVDIHMLGRTPKEMQFKDSRRLTREEILPAWEVPPPLVGLLENANYSNAREMRRTWWEDRLLGLIEDMADGFNAFFYREFPGERIEVRPDVSRIPALQVSFRERAETAEVLQRLGWSDDEIEQRLQLGRPGR